MRLRPKLVFDASQRRSFRWHLGPSAYLLVALLAELLAYPFLLDTVLWHRLILGILNITILLAAARTAIETQRTYLLVILLLGVPAIGLQAHHLFTKNEIIGNALALIYSIFYAFTIVHVLRYVLAPGDVNADKICGAVAAYILTALLWATSYMLLNRIQPGSFSNPGDQTMLLDAGDYIYFSFTTLTTTGYGDIAPRTAHARSLAILEQLAGTFYIAILIARLTALYRGRAGQSD